MSILSKSLWINAVIQFAGFVMACLFKTEKFFDLLGSGTFTLLAIKSLQWSRTMYTRQRIHTLISCIQTGRLGLFLVARILYHGSDRRFNKARDNPSTFFIYWFLQFLWVSITFTPVITVNASSRNNRPLGWRDYIGWSIAIAGTLIEVIADYQKFTFKANPANANKFITTGLWGWCRHPNYLGEIAHWFGMFIASTSVVTGRHYWYSLLSPVFTALLLTQVSGIPLLQRSGQKRWGHEPSYQEYIANTKKLIPYIW